MIKLILTFIFGLFIFSCNNQKTHEIGAEKSIFSEHEIKIINSHFKPDSAEKKIEAVKIQTH